jgi:hypothetical protein
VFGGVGTEGFDEALSVAMSASGPVYAVNVDYTYTRSSCCVSSTKLCTALAFPVAWSKSKELCVSTS